MRQWLALVLFIAVASASDQCRVGPSYWCTNIKNAKECGAFQHCLTGTWKNQKLEKDDGEVCTYCENFVADAKSFITNKQTEGQIRQFMTAACSIIPVASMATECKQVVNMYLDEVMALIKAEIDPQMVCSLLGLCKGLKGSITEDRQNNVSKGSLQRVPFVKVPAAQAEPICADCKKFMQDIKSQVTSPATEKQIEALLEQNLCSMLGALADECKALVESYVPELMELLSTEFDPAQLCQVMGFCAQNGSTPRALLAKMRLTKSPLYKAGQLLAGDADCEICKTMVTEVQSMIKDQKTQKEVEDFIKAKICSLLGAMKGACEESVDEYGPELFALLVEESDPSKVCQALGLCTSTGRLLNIIQPVRIQPHMLGVPPAPAKPKPVKASATCILCEFVMNKLDGMLKQNATEDEIKQALEKVCSFLPTTISQECQDFVDMYAPAIIQILAQELSPEVVCTTIGLCRTPSKVVSSMILSSATCGVCETLIQYVDTLLSEKSTVEEIEHVVEKVCNFLPKTYATECDDIVKKYGPAIINLIAQFGDPKEVCTEIGLCGNKMKEMPMEKIEPSKPLLLGSNKCTYGPAYWCASHENAVKCKAVAHCKKHVWKN